MSFQKDVIQREYKEKFTFHKIYRGEQSLNISISILSKVNFKLKLNCIKSTRANSSNFLQVSAFVPNWPFKSRKNLARGLQSDPEICQMDKFLFIF